MQSMIGRRRPRGLGSWSRRSAAFVGFALALAAALAGLLAGAGYRLQWWDLATAFAVLRWAVYGAIIAAALCLIGVIVAALSRAWGRLTCALLGLTMAAVTVAVPWSYLQAARRLPPIHDITTDTAQPPRFVAIVPHRRGAPNPIAYGGPEVAALQRDAYPQVRPATLEIAPDRAFDAALAVARDMGWEIVAAVPGAGRIEATDTTFWFGFKDDVVVRITPTDGGSRVDVRSVSRVGRSDVGANAERILSYLTALRSRVDAR